MELNRINGCIFKGLKYSCYESTYFNQFLYPDIKPEYLLTVNIAQSIYTEYQDELIIKLEEKTEDFKKASVEINYLVDFQVNYLNDFRIKRKGRIDIGLHNRDGYSICPIEIKGFNQPDKLILEDIKRIVNFMMNTNVYNSIECGIIAFLVEHKKCYLKSQKNEGLVSIKSKYVNIIVSSFKDYSTDLKFFVHTDTTHEELINEEELSTIADEDLTEILNEKAHYIGVVINIIKNKNQPLTLITYEQ